MLENISNQRSPSMFVGTSMGWPIITVQNYRWENWHRSKLKHTSPTFCDWDKTSLPLPPQLSPNEATKAKFPCGLTWRVGTLLNRKENVRRWWGDDDEETGGRWENRNRISTQSNEAGVRSACMSQGLYQVTRAVLAQTLPKRCTGASSP